MREQERFGNKGFPQGVPLKNKKSLNNLQDINDL